MEAIDPGPIDQARSKTMTSPSSYNVMTSPSSYNVWTRLISVTRDRVSLPSELVPTHDQTHHPKRGLIKLYKYDTRDGVWPCLFKLVIPLVKGRVARE